MSKEQHFIGMLMEEVFECKYPGVMYGDNEALIYLTKNKHVSGRTKHINTKEPYVREHIEKGYGKLVKIKSEDNVADILTNNLSVQVFDKLSKAILNGFKGWEDKFDAHSEGE